MACEEPIVNVDYMRGRTKSYRDSLGSVVVGGRNVVSKGGVAMVPVTEFDDVLFALGGANATLGSKGKADEIRSKLEEMSIQVSNRYDRSTGTVEQTFEVPVTGHVSVTAGDANATFEVNGGSVIKAGDMLFSRVNGRWNEFREFGPCILPVPTFDTDSIVQLDADVFDSSKRRCNERRLCHRTPNLRNVSFVDENADSMHASVAASKQGLQIDLKRVRLVTNLGTISPIPTARWTQKYHIRVVDGKVDEQLWVVEQSPEWVTSFDVYARIERGSSSQWTRLGRFGGNSDAGSEAVMALPSGATSPAASAVPGEGVRARFLRVVPAAASRPAAAQRRGGGGGGGGGWPAFRVAVYGRELSASERGEQGLPPARLATVRYSLTSPAAVGPGRGGGGGGGGKRGGGRRRGAGGGGWLRGVIEEGVEDAGDGVYARDYVKRGGRAGLARGGNRAEEAEAEAARRAAAESLWSEWAREREEEEVACALSASLAGAEGGGGDGGGSGEAGDVPAPLALCPAPACVGELACGCGCCCGGGGGEAGQGPEGVEDGWELFSRASSTRSEEWEVVDGA